MGLIQIKNNMRELRLLGMLQDVDIVIDQLNKNKLTALECLDMLLEKEKDIRSVKSTQARIIKSKIRKGPSLEDYDLSHDRRLNKDSLRELSGLTWCSQGQGLLIVGPTGVGKTYLASALGVLACQKGMATLFMSMCDFLENQAIARAQNRFIQFRERLVKPQLLILDDLGMRKMNSVEAEDLREIIEQRSYGKSTVITTQLPLDHWAEVIGDVIILDAIIDRVKGHAKIINLSGKSYREKLSKKNN